MFELLFGLVFLTVIGVFIMNIVRGVGEWNRNNQSPRLTVSAVVCAKRTDVTHHHHNDASTGAMHVSTSTTYYVTFEVESGDRLEFHVSGREYGMLAEGDRGMLNFQGTRYLSFERI
ncbi:MAG: DUF2500 domain-containing protein [Butyricicoccaceae bacterium]